MPEVPEVKFQKVFGKKNHRGRRGYPRHPCAGWYVLTARFAPGKCITEEDAIGLVARQSQGRY